MKTFDNTFWKIFIPFLLIIFVILFFPYWFTKYSWFNIDFSDTGGIGSTIGGILGPFIAIAAAILTFFAFWVQYKANEQQKKDLQRERFENKFYELIRLHKANVDEISIHGYSQHKTERRRAFVSMYKEFRYCYFVTINTHEILLRNKSLVKSYDDLLLLKLAYIFFYAGVGSHSEIVNKAMIGDEFEELLFSELNH